VPVPNCFVTALLAAALIAVKVAGTAVPVPMPEPEPEWLPYEATAYTANCRGCSGITAAGIDVRHTINDEDGRRIIAVDPKVIPLGTVIEIRLSDGTVIDGVAADKGGAIKGQKVDVLHKTRKEALEFGRQMVELRIINNGGNANE